MKRFRFIHGDDRQQLTLLPAFLDDYIADDNPVRIVDLFMDQRDLGAQGFRAIPATTGRPSYHPWILLRL